MLLYVFLYLYADGDAMHEYNTHGLLSILTLKYHENMYEELDIFSE